MLRYNRLVVTFCRRSWIWSLITAHLAGLDERTRVGGAMGRRGSSGPLGDRTTGRSAGRAGCQSAPPCPRTRAVGRPMREYRGRRRPGRFPNAGPASPHLRGCPESYARLSQVRGAVNAGCLMPTAIFYNGRKRVVARPTGAAPSGRLSCGEENWMRRELPSVVLLIDYDNLEIGASYDMPGRPLDLGSLIELAQRYGTVVVARAYADWGDPNERLAVYESGIEPCFAPIFRAGSDQAGKSLADTVLVADGVDILWRVAPEVLVLVTSDKDILPLARLARLRGTRTVVVGSDRTALPLRRLADEYVTYRDMVRGTGVPVPNNQRAGLVPLSRNSGTELRGPRLLGEAPALPATRKPAEPRVATTRRRPADAEARAAAAVVEPRPAVEAAPPVADEAAALRPGAEGAAAPRRRRRRRGGRGGSGGEAAVGFEGTEIELTDEQVQAGESEEDSPPIPGEVLAGLMGSPGEPGLPVDSTPFALRDVDSAAPTGAEAQLVEADALEEQAELAPAAPLPPTPPRPSFGSFGPLVPNDPLSLEFPRGTPSPAANLFGREPNGGTTAPDSAWQPGTTAAPAARGTMGPSESAEERSDEATSAEVATPPPPRRRTPRAPSRGRRTTSKAGEPASGDSPEQTPG